MKLISKDIEQKNGSGRIIVIPEENEDLWHLYHIIGRSDRINASTIRKVQKETNTGSTTSERVKIRITVAADKIDFDPKGGSLRISGKNVSESKYIKMGQFHTLEIEVNRKVSISKARWDHVHLERISDAVDVKKKADVAAIVMTEGSAHICLITNCMTLERLKVEKTIPKKRFPEAHEKGLKKFFNSVIRGLKQNVDFSIVKCVILASPGFTNEQFYQHLLLHARQTDDKDILKNQSIFILVHTSSGHKQALQEVLSDPKVLQKMQDTKAATEIKAIQDFFEMMRTTSEKAFYGPTHVMQANDLGAIETLLITDELFRASDVKTRKKYVELVESVNQSGGRAIIFSSLHASGEQLANLGGIAAILRFPVAEIDLKDSDSESDDD